MYTSHLGKYIFTHDRNIGCNGNATISLYQTTNVIQFVFPDIGTGIEMVFQNYLNACQWSITTSFSQSVHRYMYSLTTTKHGCQRIGYRQIIIIVRMEIKMLIGITLHHLAHELYTLQGIHNTQGIWKHEAFNVRLRQYVHHLIDIFHGIRHSITPIFQVEIHVHTMHVRIFHTLHDVFNMFLRCLLQLLLTMFERAFCQ